MIKKWLSIHKKILLTNKEERTTGICNNTDKHKCTTLRERIQFQKGTDCMTQFI